MNTFYDKVRKSEEEAERLEGPFTVYDVINANYSLEPLVCLHCGSTEVVFLFGIGDAVCQECGLWQLDLGNENPDIRKEVQIDKENLFN